MMADTEHPYREVINLGPKPKQKMSDKLFNLVSDESYIEKATYAELLDLATLATLRDVVEVLRELGNSVHMLSLRRQK